MKKLFVAIVFCVSGVVIPAKSDTYTNFDYQIKRKKQIPLKGGIKKEGIRSVSDDPIIVFLEDNSITTYFFRDLGNISITITDYSGSAVYSALVNSTAGTVSVPISTLPSGTYTITFSNGDGSMWGDFEI